MGDLKGHLLPGSLFLLYGIWWCIGALRRYLMCRKAGTRYISTATFPFPCSCGKLGTWPIEGIAKIALPAFGMIAEIAFNLPHPNMGIVQHATMYFFFLLSGIVDLIMYLGVPLPPGTDYVSIALAFTVEGLLFANHLSERPVVDVQIHLLLVYVVFVTVFVVLLEARFQRSAMLTLARSYLLMLQGSWFWGVGIILYGHGKNSTVWKLDSHMDAMQATIYFSWHGAAHFIVLVILASIMSRCYRVQGGKFRNGSELAMTILNNGDKPDGYNALTIPDDDSDIEFERPVDASLLPS
uniref:Transmembrane protein 45B n=1 Tax=Arion vulgaris TaxID=1028688 RepID=A0A0B6ZZ84_9EUPU